MKLSLSRVFVVLTALFLCQHSLAQTTSNSINDKERSKKYAKMAADTAKVNIPKAKEYALKSYFLAKRCESDSLILRSSKTLGILYKMLENIDSSQYYSEVAIVHADKVGNKQVAAALTTLIANTYTEAGEYKKAYTFFDDAEKRYKVMNADSIDPTYFFFKTNKANLFYRLTLYDMMLEELFEAERIADSIGDDNFTAQILGSIAIGYKYYGDLEKSTVYSKKSLKYLYENDLDEAIILTNIGNNYSEMNKVDSALYYYDRAREIYQSKNAGPVSFCKLDIAQAEMFLKNDLPKEAEKILGQIVDTIPHNTERAKINLLKCKLTDDLSKKMNYAEQSLKYSLLCGDILLQKEGYFALYEGHKKLGEFSRALRNYEEYQALEDSIFNREKSKAIQKVVLEKLLGEKDAEMRFQQLKFEKDKAEKDRTILFVVLILVLILVVLGLLYFRYRSQKQKTRIEIQAKELLERENEGIKNELVHIVFESDRNFEILKGAKEKLKEIKKSSDKETQINSLTALITRFVSDETEKRNYKDRVNEVKEDFFEKIGQDVKLTKTEKKMAALLKLDLSTKEIATILNVTDATIEVYRSRLRKKLKIDKEQSLSEFFNSL